MSLVKYAKSCSKNVAGALGVYVAESSNVTAVTVVGGEVTGITGIDAFKEIEADLDTVIKDQEEGGTDKTSYQHKVGFKISKQDVDVNTLRNSLADASPCGMLAIVVDNNGQAWLVGYSEAEGTRRGLMLEQDNDTTGEDPFADESMKADIVIGRQTGYLDLPLDATQSAAIIAGSAAYIEYVASISSPTDIAGLELWLEADDGVTITGSGVSDWDDKSTNDYDAVQTTDADRPTNPAAVINAKSVIRFDGASEGLDVDTGIQSVIHGEADFTLFFVARKTTGGAVEEPIFSSGSGTGRIQLNFYGVGGIRSLAYDGASRGASASSGVPNDTFHAITLKFVAATSTLYLYVNGVLQVGTTLASFSGGTPVTHIGQTVAGANFLTGDVAEVVGYSSELSDGDRGNVEDYLIDKYNL